MPVAETVTAPLDHDHWERRLGELAAQHAVIGAELGIRTIASGEITGSVALASGILNQDTGIPTNPNSIFETGSISKVWTTALVMQLVDEGLLELETPVSSVLPEFALAETGAAAHITVRHLLTHSSGIDGDLFRDTGRGDGAVARYVETLSDAVLIHPVGEGFSYCNSGFVIAGLIIETLRGQNWDEALRTHLIEPLGLEHTVTLPEQAILHSTAIGHTVDEKDVTTRAGVWGIARSMGPAGSIVSTVHDQLVFATALLRDGVAENGVRILSETSARAMRDPQLDLTDRPFRFSGWGLGWFLEQWGDQVTFGHDGGTIAQRAFLRVFPEKGLIVCLLTNAGDRGSVLYQELFGEIAAAWDIGLPPAVEPQPTFQPDAAELARYAGTYETAAVKLVFRVDDGALTMEELEKLSLDPTAELGASQRFTLHPVEAGRFALRGNDKSVWDGVSFFATPGGAYVAYGHRALPRTR